MESGAREVPPTLTVQNDLIWTVLTLIGILPVSTQIGVPRAVIYPGNARWPAGSLGYGLSV
jgi:hypothetical protein